MKSNNDAFDLAINLRWLGGPGASDKAFDAFVHESFTVPSQGPLTDAHVRADHKNRSELGFSKLSGTKSMIPLVINVITSKRLRSVINHTSIFDVFKPNSARDKDPIRRHQDSRHQHRFIVLFGHGVSH